MRFSSCWTGEKAEVCISSVFLSLLFPLVSSSTLQLTSPEMGPFMLVAALRTIALLLRTLGEVNHCLATACRLPLHSMLRLSCSLRQAYRCCASTAPFRRPVAPAAGPIEVPLLSAGHPRGSAVPGLWLAGDPLPPHSCGKALWPGEEAP